MLGRHGRSIHSSSRATPIPNLVIVMRLSAARPSGHPAATPGADRPVNHPSLQSGYAADPRCVGNDRTDRIGQRNAIVTGRRRPQASYPTLRLCLVAHDVLIELDAAIRLDGAEAVDVGHLAMVEHNRHRSPTVRRATEEDDRVEDRRRQGRRDPIARGETAGCRRRGSDQSQTADRPGSPHYRPAPARYPCVVEIATRLRIGRCLLDHGAHLPWAFVDGMLDFLQEVVVVGSLSSLALIPCPISSLVTQ